MQLQLHLIDKEMKGCCPVQVLCVVAVEDHGFQSLQGWGAHPVQAQELMVSLGSPDCCVGCTSGTGGPGNAGFKVMKVLEKL